MKQSHGKRLTPRGADKIEHFKHDNCKLKSLMSQITKRQLPLTNKSDYERGKNRGRFIHEFHNEMFLVRP